MTHPQTHCSQCGGTFGPGEEGFSDCRQHAATITPLPWNLHDCGRDGWKIHAPKAGMVAAMPAWASHDHLRAEQAKNAHLIVGSPRLLAAAQKAVARWYEIASALPVNAAVEDAEWREFNELRNAIAAITEAS